MKKLLEPRHLAIAGLAIALALVNGMALHKESVLARGRQVFVELAPVDPRSLMEGDYMRLDYAIDRWRQMPEPDGKLIAKVDARGVAHFERFGGVTSAPDEVVLQYKTRRDRARIGADAFYFEEGQDQHFAAAKYGELRVTANGQSVLVGLRDADLKPL
jgi:uncharacterized membrane-anchored protein